jgi:hypothetical protein
MKRLKKSQNFITRTMSRVAEVQQRYQAMGAPSTQNVRNPLPMHILVASVLPVLPHPKDLIPCDVSAEIKGKPRQLKMDLPAELALGDGYWQKKAMTVDDVVDTLRAKGFIAMRGTVAMALSQTNGTVVHSVAGKPTGNRGRAQSRYFVAVS